VCCGTTSATPLSWAFAPESTRGLLAVGGIVIPVPLRVLLWSVVWGVWWPPVVVAAGCLPAWGRLLAAGGGVVWWCCFLWASWRAQGWAFLALWVAVGGQGHTALAVHSFGLIFAFLNDNTAYK
jgi:hypothetical protein